MKKEIENKKWLRELKDKLVSPPKIKALRPQEQEKIILEKASEVYTKKDLIEKLRKSERMKKPLRIKYGIDPTSSELHLGHFVVLRQLKKLQDLGHQVIFLIGDFTARIGDPSDKKAARRPLTAQQVRKNMKDYFFQVSRFIDFSKSAKVPAKVAYNSQWLSKLSLEEFLPLTSTLTVARMLERDCFAKRFKAGKPISITEFIYPLLQGYDSVKLKADIEVGGRDQTFNMLVGRELQERYWSQEPQVVLAYPLISGLDGQKMSKTLKNYVSLTDKPKDVYGKIMSLPDNLMKEYFLLLTDLTERGWSAIERKIEQGCNPMRIKEILAEVITAELYNAKIARREKERFIQLFSERKVISQKFEDIKEKLPKPLLDILYDNRIIKAKMQIKRLFKQNAIKLIKKDGSQEVIKDAGYMVYKSGTSFKVGKKIFITVIGS